MVCQKSPKIILKKEFSKYDVCVKNKCGVVFTFTNDKGVKEIIVQCKELGITFNNPYIEIKCPKGLI